MLARPYYLSEAAIGARTLDVGSFILGIIGFGAPPPRGYAAEGPFAAVSMAQLSDDPAYEVWAGPIPAAWHEEDGARFAIAGDTLFATLHAADPSERGLQADAFGLYSRMFALADRTGHPHVIRAYNYIPRIHAEEGGIERYRRFNAGRHEAFVLSNRAVQAAPAACALGTSGGPLVISFVASSSPGRPIENPRQLSAYNYPPAHGPRSPSFSRAMLTGASPDMHLHMSGTASIVGHQSVHLGDAAAQTAEIIRNIHALLAQCGGLRVARDGLFLRVYVRNRDDIVAIRAGLETLAPVRHVMFLQAEICRRELLVEIEGFGELA